MNLPKSKFVPVATLKAQMELMQAQIAESEAVEKATAKIIAEIKKANIEPSVLTAILQAENLITVESNKTEEKVTAFSTEVTTDTNRKSNFKIWIGRDVTKLNGDALKYWNSIKTIGKDKFVEQSTPEGKAFYETETGKTWLANAFK